MLRPILFFWFFLAACGDNTRPPPLSETCDVGPEAYAANPSAYKTVSLWVQDDPDLSQSAALEGCDLWQSKCLRCELASESQAAAKIYASHETCVLDLSKGGFILAVAKPKGEITVYLACVRLAFGTDSDGRVNQEKLKLVIGHELGHESGMPYHVPATCDASAAASDFEKGLVQDGICGLALMNAVIDPQINAITQLDAEAYDLRDQYSSTFPRINATETPDGCVLTWPVH
jgi:hypothetical protein